MALINRLTRLFKADLHTVIDQLEEPVMLLKQAVREMEETLQEEQQRLKEVQNRLEQMDRRYKKIGRTITTTDEELDICFEAESETLARQLIKRKLEAQQQQKNLTIQQENLQQRIKQHQQEIDEQQPKLDEMRQKLESLSTGQPQQSRDPFSITDGTTIIISDADIEVALLREKQQRSRS